MVLRHCDYGLRCNFRFPSLVCMWWIIACRSASGTQILGRPWKNSAFWRASRSASPSIAFCSSARHVPGGVPSSRCSSSRPLCAAPQKPHNDSSYKGASNPGALHPAIINP